MKPKLHVLFPFHTEPNEAYSHCAFTGKAERFVEMMSRMQFEVIEYSNGRSDSDKYAAKRHMILSAAELDALKKKQIEGTGKGAFHGDYAIIGGKVFNAFEERLKKVLPEDLDPLDIVCHPFGHGHAGLAKMGGIHVETGIGYPTVWSQFKIYESYAWLHYSNSKENKQGRAYEWVVPNYYRTSDWPLVEKPEGYLLFAGRIADTKGISTLVAIAEALGEPIKIAGQGDLSPWTKMLKEGNKHLLEHIGEIKGAERAKVYGNAKAIIAPSNFIEPFCGVTVEAMMTGTPVISTHFGAFTETLEHGKTGYRCHTLNDYLEGINRSVYLDRKYISDRAKSLFSLETCGRKYDAIFRQIYDLHSGGGWYTCPHFLDDL